MEIKREYVLDGIVAELNGLTLLRLRAVGEVVGGGQAFTEYWVPTAEDDLRIGDTVWVFEIVDAALAVHFDRIEWTSAA